MYNDYVANPDSVEPDMKKFFEGFDFAISSATNGTKNGGANGHVNGNGTAVAAKETPAATSDNWKGEIPSGITTLRWPWNPMEFSEAG